MDSMTLTALIGVLAQLGMGAGAWKLANALRLRVDDHEKRIGKLEADVST